MLFIIYIKEQTKPKFFCLGVKWSFYPSLNTVKCQNLTEGHRANTKICRAIEITLKKKGHIPAEYLS
jgi:hypothetical protein